MATKKQIKVAVNKEEAVDKQAITSIGFFSKTVEDMIMLDSRDANLRNLLFEKIRELNGESS